MSNKFDKMLDDLVEENFVIFKEAGDRIIKNAIDFHKRECKDRTNTCEMMFVAAFIEVFGGKIREEQNKEMGRARKVFNFYNLN